MVYFDKGKLKKRLSVLLIVALIFQMTSNNFAISDFELQDPDSKRNYYDEMINEASGSVVFEEDDRTDAILFDEEGNIVIKEEYEEEPEEDKEKRSYFPRMV